MQLYTTPYIDWFFTLNNQGPFFHANQLISSQNTHKNHVLRASGRDHGIKEKQPRRWRNVKDEFLSQTLNARSIHLQLGSLEGRCG